MVARHVGLMSERTDKASRAGHAVNATREVP